MGCCHSTPELDVLLSFESRQEIMTIAGKCPSLKFGRSSFIRWTIAELSLSYSIQGKLGQGGASTVYKAVSKSTGNECAIKSISKSILGSHRDDVQEIRNLKNLDHPNIIKIYEILEDNDYLHIVTELCKGGELFTRILRQGSFNERTAALYMKQILGALIACHSANIVHGDLKPENILFLDEGDTSLKLIDFGTSQRAVDWVSSNTFIGSCYYIAPERIEGGFDVKCDIWSAGVILYMMLSGSPPFDGPDEAIIFNKIKRGIYVFSGRKWEHVSSEARNFIQRMLVKQTQFRPSAEELLNDPWLQKRTTSELFDSPIELDSLKSLVKFKASYILEKATLSFIASYMISAEQASEIRRVFIILDVDCDGKLTTDELSEGIISTGVCSVNEIKNIMESCDSNDNGLIDYNEFLTAALSWGQLLSLQQLEAAFDAYDLDGNGRISADELKYFFASSEQSQESDIWSLIIQEVDQNNDASIDFQEFKNMMGSYLAA